MFTGIIEELGVVQEIKRSESNLIFRIQSVLAPELKIDQSVSHDGVCLTVVALGEDWHEVAAIQETLDRSALGSWRKGKKVNLERAMQWNGRLDGHIVQGHVDTVSTCLSVEDKDGSWRFTFGIQSEESTLIVPKGSICVHGISLTANEPTGDQFSVDIIPYTYEHTNISSVREGDQVNLEFDILGKYVQRQREAFAK